MAGGKVKLAVEWNDNAVETYKENFPDTPVYHGDIANLTANECCELANMKPGELDILDGSPPCQGFSGSGKRNLADSRNQLFNEYIRLLKVLRPKVFVMENVAGLIRGKMKLIFAEIMNQMESCGYKVRARLLNPMYFGVPQSRSRVIFLGIDKAKTLECTYPKAQTRPMTLRMALDNVPADEGQGTFTGERLEFSKCIKPGGAGGGIIKGRRYNFNLQRLAWGKPSRSVLKLVGGTKSKWGGGLIHPQENRHMTISELKRISTFPDEFKFIGDFQTQWARIGNSVPPRFMYAIAEHIRDKILAV